MSGLPLYRTPVLGGEDLVIQGRGAAHLMQAQIPIRPNSLYPPLTVLTVDQAPSP